MSLRTSAACALLIFSATPVVAEPSIDSSKAAFYVGSQVMVCGIVTEVRPFSKGTYLNMGGRHPNQHITVLVWNGDEPGFKSRFGSISAFQGQRACARGMVESFKNTLQVKVSNPQFLRLMK